MWVFMRERDRDRAECVGLYEGERDRSECVGLYEGERGQKTCWLVQETQGRTFLGFYPVL